jgi:hypothetical protein
VVKWPGLEADHSPPSSAEVKGVELYPHSPNTPSWRGAQLKHNQSMPCLLIIMHMVKCDILLNDKGMDKNEIHLSIMYPSLPNVFIPLQCSPLLLRKRSLEIRGESSINLVSPRHENVWGSGGMTAHSLALVGGEWSALPRGPG